MGFKRETYLPDGSLVEVVDTRDLDEEKVAKVTELQTLCEQWIYAQTPLTQQVNVVLGTLGVQGVAGQLGVVTAMVQAARNQCISLEDQVTAAPDFESLSKIVWVPPQGY